MVPSVIIVLVVDRWSSSIEGRKEGRKDVKGGRRERRWRGGWQPCKGLLTTVARPGLLTAPGFRSAQPIDAVFHEKKKSFDWVAQRVERTPAKGEWLSYWEQCLVRRFALR